MASGNYGQFGIANTRMWVKPGKIKGIIIGEFQTGKTSLFSSNPACLIINLDLSSTPVPTVDYKAPPAQFWPGLNSDGRPIRVDGSPFVLNWDEIVKFKDKLVEAFNKNLPRPETIAIDSATELFNILRQATLEHFKKESWDEGRGDAMWEWLYQQYNSFVNDLRNAGYGVWVILHIAPEYITEEDGKKKTKWAMTTPPGFFKRFYGGFEMALEMRKTFERKVIPYTEDVVTTSGAVIKLEKTRVEDVVVFTLIGDNPERANHYKRRICLPKEIRLGSTDMWATFEKAYLEAAVPPAAPASK